MGAGRQCCLPSSVEQRMVWTWIVATLRTFQNSSGLSSGVLPLMIDSQWPLATWTAFTEEVLGFQPLGNHSFIPFRTPWNVKNTMAIVLCFQYTGWQNLVPWDPQRHRWCLANVNCIFCKDAVFHCVICCDLGSSSLLWNEPRCFASFKDLTWPWPAL